MEKISVVLDYCYRLVQVAARNDHLPSFLTMVHYHKATPVPAVALLVRESEERSEEREHDAGSILIMDTKFINLQVII